MHSGDCSSPRYLLRRWCSVDGAPWRTARRVQVIQAAREELTDAETQFPFLSL